MEYLNHMNMRFDAKSVNESLARMTVAAFMMDMNPTLDEIQDVKTAVSEAVTNAIIHGYPKEAAKSKDDTMMCHNEIEMCCSREDETLRIVIIDKGVGIADIALARQPFFTTKPEEERSGMGFSFMETFMDEVEVFSKPGEGTRIIMTKYVAGERGQ